MTYLVGYGSGNDDHSASELAAQLARARPERVVAVAVVPKGWGTPAVGGTDREYRAWAAGEGRAAADDAQAALADAGVDGKAVWVAGRSAPATLIDEAEARDASMIVVGSADDAGPGQVRLASKTDRRVHSSTVPVAIAPRGYRTKASVERVTVGFRDDDVSWSLLTRVADLVRETGARLRVATFMVKPTRRPATNTVSHAQTQIIELWSMQATAALAEAEQHLRSVGFGDELETELAVGDEWSDTVEAAGWQEGDILVLGSCSTHCLAQVFLGSSASKILRSSPVPVVVVPGVG